MPETDTWECLVGAHEQSRSKPHRAVSAHEPVAAILACSDARVPPSVIFDQPAGKLFVVRIAGNSASPAAVASLDYAVSELGVDLVIVLGHTGCGAVAAAAAGTCEGYLAPIVQPICQLAKSHPGAGIDELVASNVANTVEALSAHSGPVGSAIRSGEVTVQGAIHHLKSGQLALAEPASTLNLTTTEAS